MITLYSAEICPFVQRTRALLTHLGLPFEIRTIDLSDRDPDFLELTPTGKVPLMIDDGLKLYESQVINDYLAEKYGWADAYPGTVDLRARQRLAMKMWDGDVVPAFYRSLKDPESLDPRRRRRIVGGLAEMTTTIRAMDGGAENLLGFHCAPHWARMDWMRPHTPVPPLVDEQPDLREWLDRTITLPAVVMTLPDREITVSRYEEHFVGRTT